MSLQFDQLGKPVFGRRLDLALVLAQLGRNPVEAQRPVDLLFGRARHPLVALEPEQAVFVERQPELQRPLPQRDVVVLAAREILHRRAEALLRQRPDVHLDALQPDLRAGLVRALAQHLVHPRMLVNRSRAASGAGPVTSRSRSPTVSLPRRRLPAGVTFSTPSVPRRNVISSLATPSAKLSRNRPAL